MVITLGPDLEAALNEQARRRGVTAEVVVLDTPREHFILPEPPVQPQDEWERRLLGLANHCGVYFPTAP